MNESPDKTPCSQVTLTATEYPDGSRTITYTVDGKSYPAVGDVDKQAREILFLGQTLAKIRAVREVKVKS